jgi:hypothetical protein
MDDDDPLHPSSIIIGNVIEVKNLSLREKRARQPKKWYIWVYVTTVPSGIRNMTV